MYKLVSRHVFGASFGVRNPRGMILQGRLCHHQFSVVMAIFTGLLFALTLSKYLQVMGQHRCSSSGISGCECFLGACDADGKPKDSLNIAKHVPLGLELFGHVNNPLAERNLAHLCEGRTVAIRYDF